MNDSHDKFEMMIQDVFFINPDRTVFVGQRLSLSLFWNGMTADIVKHGATIATCKLFASMIAPCDDAQKRCCVETYGQLLIDKSTLLSGECQLRESERYQQ